MKHLFIFIPLLIALTSLPLHAQQHNTHNYMGSHGMALIALANGDTLAYHMALYAKPHNFQLLYKLALTEAQKAHIRRHTFYTLLPDNFDLQRLIGGEKLEIGATLYAGHFERGGEKITRFNKVVFEQQLYQNPLPARNTEAATQNTLHFDLLSLDNQNNPDDNLTLAIHKINLHPSFDAIVVLPSPAREQSRFTCNTSAATNAIAVGAGSGYNAQIIAQLSKSCLSRAPVYAEFMDFR